MPVKEYAECKMVVERRDKKGEPVSTFTTWRADFIQAVLDGAQVVDFEAGEEVDITIRKNDETENKYV